jgi:hypothetical protein
MTARTPVPPAYGVGRPRTNRIQIPSMLPQELIRCDTTIGARAGSFLAWGAAEAVAPQDTETRMRAAAARVLWVRMPVLMSGTLRR